MSPWRAICHGEVTTDLTALRRKIREATRRRRLWVAVAGRRQEPDLPGQTKNNASLI